VTTNPLLNSDFFVPGGVDEITLKANEGVEHCLLDCPGRYTVRVATFSCRNIVAISDKDVRKAMAALEQRSPEDSELVRAAEKAHKLAAALRNQGVEAYEFHDHKESIVTVGSFESAGMVGDNDEVKLDPAVAKVMEQYRANAAQGKIAAKSLAGVPFDAQPKVILVPKRTARAAMRFTRNTSR
jgi:hypothetical protein